jgi:N-acetylglucosaminyl-diphospho-decaprenol L-rhamnosyltransferase
VTLSIIIVNYNVKYFLEQCLCSVMKATAGLESEIFVVDNNSSDKSLDYLSPKFPAVYFISNPDNRGFGKANNQALKLSSGKNVLFLNPDTIVGEESLKICLSFLEQHAQAGAVGAYMVDGSGHFLRESRRGLPTPWVSFCKICGLTGLFPRSRLFAHYYLGHQDNRVNNQVEVLPGAFMMVKKEALDKTGGFDERFFMYAEDIDLSYRILQAGYLNYSLANSSIIHFKGESTRKDRQYVKNFYKAMSQFMHKHFGSGVSVVFVAIMDAAIWFRAAMQAGLSLFASQKNEQQPEPIPYFLEGDPGDFNGLAAILAKHNRVPASGRENAAEIIFCEGEVLSFSRIIASFQETAQLRYMIHAEKSSGIVGSHSKDNMGEVIPFDE